jgi:hypothetical protein
MFQTFHTLHPKHLLESVRHGFYHGMMEDVLNDESKNISLSHQSSLQPAWITTNPRGFTDDRGAEID